MAHNSESTRLRILNAALAEFATRGVAGARVDRIAAAAKANKESIYRYYGGKRELLNRVLEEYLTVRGDVVSPHAENIEGYPVDLFRLYQQNPDFLRLALWEGLECGSEMDDDAFQRRSEHYTQKVEAIRQAQEAGSVDPCLDPRHLMIVLLGMSNYWFAVPQIVRLIFQGEPNAETYATHEKFLAECCRRILTPPNERPDRHRDERLKLLVDEISLLLSSPFPSRANTSGTSGTSDEAAPPSDDVNT